MVENCCSGQTGHVGQLRDRDAAVPVGFGLISCDGGHRDKRKRSRFAYEYCSVALVVKRSAFQDSVDKVCKIFYLIGT